MILFLPRPLFSIFISIWYNTIFLFPISSSTTFCVLHLLSFYICFLFFYFSTFRLFWITRSKNEAKWRTKKIKRGFAMDAQVQWVYILLQPPLTCNKRWVGYIYLFIYYQKLFCTHYLFPFWLFDYSKNTLLV